MLRDYAPGERSLHSEIYQAGDDMSPGGTRYIPLDQPDRKGSSPPYIASSCRNVCRTLFIGDQKVVSLILARSPRRLQSTHPYTMRSGRLLRLHEALSPMTPLGEHLAVSYMSVIRLQNGHARYITFPNENFSHLLSYMKYTLDTQFGRMSMTPIAINSPSSLYIWWYDPYSRGRWSGRAAG